MAALAQRELKITREHIADSMAQLRAAGKDLNGRPSIAGEGCHVSHNVSSYGATTTYGVKV